MSDVSDVDYKKWNEQEADEEFAIYSSQIAHAFCATLEHGKDDHMRAVHVGSCFGRAYGHREVLKAIEGTDYNSIESRLALMAEGEGSDYKVYMRMAKGALDDLRELKKRFGGKG